MSHIFDALNKGSDNKTEIESRPRDDSPGQNEEKPSETLPSQPLVPEKKPPTGTPPIPKPRKHEPYFQVSLDKAPGPDDIPPELMNEHLVPQNVFVSDLLTNPRPKLLHELSALRDSLELVIQRRGRRVITFTGSVTGEGSTTIAAHYAHLLAGFADQRILLIDGDMGRSNRFSLSRAVDEWDGFTELLRADLPLEQVVLKSEVPNLHFLPAGQDQINFVEAVRRGNIRGLFDRLSRSYDALIIDCPGVLEHAETTYLGAASDGVVLIIKANTTRRELVQQALAKLNRARCRILGTVLNEYDEKIPSFLNERI